MEQNYVTVTACIRSEIRKKITDRKTPLEVSLTIFHVFVNGGEFDLSH